MRRRLPVVSVVASVAVCVACIASRTGGALPRPAPIDSAVVMPVRPSAALVPCSRHGPPEFDGLWSPTLQVIRTMESRFPRLLRLRSEECCLPGRRIQRLEAYRLQYVGLVVAGRRWIYVNAFCDDPPRAWDSTQWVDTCDGGTCFWGALYDPETGEFRELAFNGVG